MFKQYLSATQDIGKVSLTIGFYISIILAILSFIGIVAVFFFYQFGWKKTEANVTSISCGEKEITTDYDKTVTTTTIHPSTYSFSWDVDGVPMSNTLTKDTTQCTECQEGSSTCVPSTVDILYNPNTFSLSFPKNTSEVAFKTNTRIVFIIILFILIVFFSIGAVVNFFSIKSKAMTTLAGVSTEASVVKSIFNL